MNDPELDNLSRVVAKAAAGITTISKSEIYGRMRDAARRLAKAGDTMKTMCRLYYDRGAPYFSIYKAYSARLGTSQIAKTALAPNDSDGDGTSLDAMVQAHMVKFPNISKGAATAAVINTPKGAAVYARERNARLTKALRG